MKQQNSSVTVCGLLQKWKWWENRVECDRFDLRDANTASIRIETSQMQGYLLTGATRLELIEHYSVPTLIH